jgi:hypothetical protein
MENKGKTRKGQGNYEPHPLSMGAIFEKSVYLARETGLKLPVRPKMFFSRAALFAV